MSFTDEQIAQIAHEAGRELSIVLEEEPDAPWTSFDSGARGNEASLVKAARHGASPEAVHEKRMQLDPDLGSFDTLTPGERAHEYLFAGICAAMNQAADVKARAENEARALAETAELLRREADRNQPFGGRQPVIIEARPPQEAP